MIAEAGHYALVLALALALIQSTVPIAGARWGDAALMNVDALRSDDVCAAVLDVEDVDLDVVGRWAVEGRTGREGGGL